MSIMLYLSKMIAISGLLYGYYILFLRNKQFHQYNRFFLLGIPVIAVFLPLVHIPVSGNAAGQGIKLLKVIPGNWEDAVVITAGHQHVQPVFSMEEIALLGYIVIALVLFYFFFRSLWYVLRISKKYNYEKIEDIRFFRTPEPGTPFSFMKNIFWNQRMETESGEGKQVLRHELYHVRQHHSTDILFMELVTISSWFNPFFHLIKNEVKVIHEFLADQYAASGSDQYDYAELLVWHSLHNNRVQLANPFFHNQIKRRITMITSHNRSRYGYISRLMALPLFALIFCAFATKLRYNNALNHITAAKTITIAIDAGHGGIDRGTISNTGILEKNINLSLSKKIEQLAPAYNVRVIMTRDQDILPGGAVNIKAGLENRVDIAVKNKADLLLSIHTDASVSHTTQQSGFSIYMSKSNPYRQENIALGSAITGEIKKTYSIEANLRQRDIPIKVLDEVPMPALLIECGFITNSKDRSFILEEKNQEKIARNILEGIVKYAAGTTADAANRMSTAADAVQTTPPATTEFPGDEQPNALDTVPAKKYPVTFTKVEFESEYPGGINAWADYLRKNLKYPEHAVKKNIQGTVLMQFIVNTDGKLSDIRVLSSPDPSLSAAATNVIKKSGKWTPAKQNGVVVQSYKKQPIVFKLSEN